MSDKISGKFHPIPRNLKKIVLFLVSMATAAILKILLKRWISIRNIIIYLETKFRPNRRIFVLWRPFLVQNHRGHHSKPKWSPYGAACLTPCKYPFPLKSVHIWIFNDFLKFLYWWPFGKFLKQRAQLWVMIYFCVKLQKDPLYGLNLTFFAPWLPWQRPSFWICSTPNSCHTLRWIFLQSFMMFDERNPKQFLISPFLYLW